MTQGCCSPAITLSLLPGCHTGPLRSWMVRTGRCQCHRVTILESSCLLLLFPAQWMRLPGASVSVPDPADLSSRRKMWESVKKWLWQCDGSHCRDPPPRAGTAAVSRWTFIMRQTLDFPERGLSRPLPRPGSVLPLALTLHLISRQSPGYPGQRADHPPLFPGWGWRGPRLWFYTATNSAFFV